MSEKNLETGEMMGSADDERVTNNVMRHQYKVLNDDEKAQMLRIKDLGLAFANELTAISAYPRGTADSDVNPLRLSSRELSLAQTKIEEAVMWAVKHVTG